MCLCWVVLPDNLLIYSLSVITVILTESITDFFFFYSLWDKEKYSVVHNLCD